MKQTVFFDLDGTLLPMDQDVFVKAYFKRLTQKAAPRGYEPKALVDGIWAGTAAMVKNDGSRTNFEAFWERFSLIFGKRVYDDIPLFDDFYRNEFSEARSVCGFQPLAGELIVRLKEQGVPLVLASNPVFPRVAQENRMRWAGLDPADFCDITSYENSHFCKPNPAYFTEICSRLSLDPKDCLMIGNDAEEDGAARAAGMEVFLVTDCLINAKSKDIAAFPHGKFEDLFGYLKLI